MATKKTTKKTPATKSTKKAATPKKAQVKKDAQSKRQDDGAKDASKRLGITTDQVRILRVLFAAKKQISMNDLKDGVGIGRDGKYSGAWLNSLKDLEAKKLITISTIERVRGYVYALEAAGRALAKKCQ